MSKETRRKMSESGKTKIFSDEHRKNISEALIGKKFSKEHRKNISQGQKGIRSGENNPFFGKNHTEETRKKMSKSKKGKNHPNFGKHHSEKTKKKMSEAKKGKYCGENSHMWKNGTSFEPYCPKFNNTFKEKVREAFDRKCFLCGKSEEDDGRKLAVHHVQYNKNCGCDDDLKCDFAPLCISCHGKTGHNHKYWENLIVEQLSYSKILIGA